MSYFTRTHLKLSLFDRILAFFSRDYLIVPKYTIRYYLRKLNVERTRSEDLDKCSNNAFKGWRSAINALDEGLNIQDDMKETIANLVVELKHKGMDEKEIAKLFVGKIQYKC